MTIALSGSRLPINKKMNSTTSSAAYQSKTFIEIATLVNFFSGLNREALIDRKRLICHRQIPTWDPTGLINSFK